MSNFVLGTPTENTALNSLQDVVVREFKCAELDLPFVGVFVRNESGIYCWARSEPIMLDAAIAHGPSAREDDIPMHQIQWTGFECAWCDADTNWPEIIHCAGCREYVCTGRTEGTLFRCTDECGHSGHFAREIKSLKVSDGISGNLDGSVRKAIGHSTSNPSTKG